MNFILMILVGGTKICLIACMRRKHCWRLWYDAKWNNHQIISAEVCKYGKSAEDIKCNQ